MYEGEVIELTPEEAESQTGGYGKVIASVVIGLKTVKVRRRSVSMLCATGFKACAAVEAWHWRRYAAHKCCICPPWKSLLPNVRFDRASWRSGMGQGLCYDSCQTQHKLYDKISRLCVILRKHGTCGSPYLRWSCKVQVR